MLPAIMQPMIAWPDMKSGAGIRTVVRAAANTIAAAIGPSNRAAGRRNSSNTRSKTTDKTTSSAPWRTNAILVLRMLPQSVAA